MPNVRLSKEGHSKAIQLSAELAKAFSRVVSLGEAVEYALDEALAARQMASENAPISTEV